MNGRIGLLPRPAAWRALAVICLLGSVLAAPAQEERRDTTAARGVRITAEQERATERALAWLARAQNDDGSWDGTVGFKLNNGYRTTREGTGHAGVTALCGMAFLAGGHLPGRGPYGEVVDRAVDFLLSCSNEDGFLSRGGTRMYSHAFATLFLAEVYGMTHREDTRVRLQKAVDFIVKSQNAEGGWRYGPQAQDSDMSIVVCQVLALRAARNIGIRVPRATIDRALEYVKASAVTRSGFGRGSSDLGTFHYQVEENSFSRSSFPLTAAGVTAMHGLGIYSDDLILRGVEFLEAEEDMFNARYGHRGHYFFWYGHYYGVQAMYTVGGDRWQRYFTKLRARLLDIQRPDGTWPNDVGPGEEFSTAMACLILEIPYSFLPIFQR